MRPLRSSRRTAASTVPGNTFESATLICDIDRSVSSLSKKQSITADLTGPRACSISGVSTDDRGQCPENQLIALPEGCTREIAAEYVEHESGRKGTERRAQFARLFEDANRRKFDLVLFWALDRFSREGMVQTMLHLQRLDSYGVKFHSYTEAHLNTDNDLVRNVLLAVVSSLAKAEAQKISERTKAGLG